MGSETSETDSSTAESLESLRSLAANDRGAAQTKTWAWLESLGEERDGDTLEALFALGTPPPAIDGPTDGILVCTLTNAVVDKLIDLLTDSWMPWTGKTFDAATATGVNQMTAGSRLPAKLLWPLYGMRETETGNLAFDFKTGIVDGVVEPSVKVLKIEYSEVSRNPLLVVRQILDELVELVPDTYLGRILFKLPTGYTNIGYFALKQPTE